MTLTPQQRLDRGTDKSAGPHGCWPWTGSTNGRGYGRTALRDGDGSRRVYASHRLAVLLSGRDLPAGMQVDHLCRNRACVNPLHLEVVTPAENVRRNPNHAAASPFSRPASQVAACLGCGGELHRPHLGRPRIYCSRSCKDRCYAQRYAASLLGETAAA